MYDARHGLYHLFYQNHLAAPLPPGTPKCTTDQCRDGPVWGHAVSRDLVRWAHLEVPFWNGPDAFDGHGLFSGSATIVDGSPVIVYPGVCDDYPPSGTRPGCKYGYTFVAVTPADPADPLLRNWTKHGFVDNPIANDTFDDPSTAWRTPAGEWRMIGHCGDGSVGECGPDKDFWRARMWGGSRDFRSWRYLGLTNLPAGECASMYPLPPLTPTERGADAPLPTHVHKYGCGPADGGLHGDCYRLGSWTDSDNSTGFWSATPGVPSGPQLVDIGSYYASKDFFDTKHGRRINWGWLQQSSVQSLPRVVTYHSVLKQLIWSPLPELEQLRSEALATHKAQPLAANVPLLLGSWADGAANTSETLVEFALPPSGTLSLTVSAGSEAAEFFVDVQREGRNATVGRKKAGRHAPQTGVLPLLPEERSVLVRLFIDNGALEAYLQGGRVCLSSKMRMPAGKVAIHVESSAPTTMKSATVWRLGSIWVTPEEVLRTPQLKTDEDSAAAAGPHVWTSPPVRIPSNMTTDAPLLGNGELGVAHGGDLASGNLTFFFAVSTHRLKSTVSRGFVLTSMPRCVAGQLLLERAGRRHLTVRLSRRGRALHE
jgi:beta-fructofuranosidase